MPASERQDDPRDRQPRETPADPRPADPRSDEYLRLLIESAADYAIFAMDPDRHVTMWNVGAQRVFGFAEDEIVGRSADLIFTPEDRANGVPDQECRTARRDGRAADERWHQRKNGERFYASGVMTPLYTGDQNLVGFAKIARDLTERKMMEEQLQNSQRELEVRVAERTAELHASNEALKKEIDQRREAESARRELLRRLANAHEDERLRLARELHDEVGQHLASLMLGLNSLERHVTSKEATGVLRNLQALTESLGREVHSLAVQLRPAALDDLGLMRAVNTLADVWSARSGIKVDLHAFGIDEPRLPPDVELTVYRVIQEALTNVLKHAGASRVSLILNRPDGEVVIIVEDDGRGFDSEAVQSSQTGGLGLLGIRERVAQFNGTMTLESEPGRGTTVFVRIPLS